MQRWQPRYAKSGQAPAKTTLHERAEISKLPFVLCAQDRAAIEATLQWFEPSWMMQILAERKGVLMFSLDDEDFTGYQIAFKGFNHADIATCRPPSKAD